MDRLRTNETSNLLPALFPDHQQHSDILTDFGRRQLGPYSMGGLEHLFKKLPFKFISICPMSICSALLSDMDSSCTDHELAALGFMMFTISMHDDVVDEMFEDQLIVAELVFSGNIAFCEAIKLLSKTDNGTRINLLTNVCQNHFYQYHNIRTLWGSVPRSFDDYLDGLQHDVEFIRIPVEFALHLSETQYRGHSLDSFIKNYGYAVQILDDVREADEDSKKGYSSYPVVEGPPYKMSVQKAVEFSNEALVSLPEEYFKTRLLAERLISEVNKLKKAFS